MSLVKSDNYNTQERLVAYFDVLGYSEIIKSDHARDFMNHIDEAIQQVKIAITKPEITCVKGLYTDKIKYRIYSDNFLILMDSNIDEVSFLVLTWVVKLIQNAFLVHHKLLLRGIIKKGNIFLNEDFVFGDVLVDLNRMEQEAEYPRIIIDKEIESIILCSKDFTVQQDFDGYYCIEYMNNYAIIIDQDIPLHSNQERRYVIELLKLWGFYEDHKLSDSKYVLAREKVIRKYIWLVETFNKVMPIEYRINYKLTLNTKIMRVEITDIF